MNLVVRRPRPLEPGSGYPAGSGDMTKEERADRKKFLAACSMAREESRGREGWMVVYRVTGRRYRPVYRVEWLWTLNLADRTFAGGWKGQVMATYRGGETWD